MTPGVFALRARVFALCLALCGSCFAQPSWPPQPSARAAPLGAPGPAPTYRTIEWNALMPAGWDGMKDFRKLDLDAMQDGDARAVQTLKQMREAWDKAPVNMALVGQAVRIAGYVVPLEQGPRGVTEFLLVPYYGACIHTPPPPANQIVHVSPRQPAKLKSMDTVWVSGVIAYARSDSYMGVSSWSLPAVEVKPFEESPQAVPGR